MFKECPLWHSFFMQTALINRTIKIHTTIKVEVLFMGKRGTKI